MLNICKKIVKLITSVKVHVSLLLLATFDLWKPKNMNRLHNKRIVDSIEFICAIQIVLHVCM